PAPCRPPPTPARSTGLTSGSAGMLTPTSPTGNDAKDDTVADALARCVGDPGGVAAEYWARAPLYRPGADPAAYADLFSLDDVDHILSSTTPRFPAFRMVKDG